MAQGIELWSPQPYLTFLLCHANPSNHTSSHSPPQIQISGRKMFSNFTLVVCFYQILKNSIAFLPEKIRLIFCRGIISFVSTCGQNPGCFTPAAKLVFYQRQTYVLPMPRAVFCWPASDNAPPTTGFCPNKNGGGPLLAESVIWGIAPDLDNQPPSVTVFLGMASQ